MPSTHRTYDDHVDAVDENMIKVMNVVIMNINMMMMMMLMMRMMTMMMMVTPGSADNVVLSSQLIELTMHKLPSHATPIHSSSSSFVFSLKVQIIF